MNFGSQADFTVLVNVKKNYFVFLRYICLCVTKKNIACLLFPMLVTQVLCLSLKSMESYILQAQLGSTVGKKRKKLFKNSTTKSLFNNKLAND